MVCLLNSSLIAFSYSFVSNLYLGIENVRVYSLVKIAVKHN